jgi:hypothetical protein
MNHSEPLAQLGHFVLTFQAVEAAMVELTVQIVDADPEYVSRDNVYTAVQFTAFSFRSFIPGKV